MRDAGELPWFASLEAVRAVQPRGGMPKQGHNGSGIATGPASLVSLGAEELAIARGGKLPPGYDEALAAGEKAAQRRSRKKLL